MIQSRSEAATALLERAFGMKKEMTKEPVVIKSTPLWLSADKKFAVVLASYPEGLPRTETRKTLTEASKLKPDTIMARRATTMPAYAKVPYKLVELVMNDLGEISP